MESGVYVAEFGNRCRPTQPNRVVDLECGDFSRGSDIGREFWLGDAEAISADIRPSFAGWFALHAPYDEPSDHGRSGSGLI